MAAPAENTCSDRDEKEDSEHARPLSKIHVKLSQPQHIVCSSCKSVGFRKLQPETDLRVAPPNWLQSEPFRSNLSKSQSQPGWTKLWLDQSGSGSNSLSNSYSSTMSLLEHAFMENKISETGTEMRKPPDFIGSANCLRKLFSIPFTNKQVSVVIHRVGRTMLINALGTAEQPQVEDDPEMKGKGFYRVEKNCVPKAIEIIVDEDEDEAETCSEPSRPSSPMSYSSSPVPGEARKKKNKLKCERKDLESRFIYYSAQTQTSNPNNRNHQSKNNSNNNRKTDKEPTSDENEDDTSWKGSFRRTILWKFQDLSLLSGSNLVLFHDENIYDREFSVRLHDVNKLLPASRCLDFYLDNRLAGVEALALCFHNRGFVRDYHIYRTEDILLLGDEDIYGNHDQKKRKRSIREIESRSSALLKFLRERCHPEKSYWLFKESGNTNVIRLCELTSSMTQTEQGRERWMYNMAMLCYRVAQQYNPGCAQNNIGSSGVEKKEGVPFKCNSGPSQNKTGSNGTNPHEDSRFNLNYNLRHRELLLKSLELLDEIANRYGGPSRYVLRAALHEQVANNYLLSVDPLVRTYNSTPHSFPTKEKREEALRFIKYSLAHWENVNFFIQEERRSRMKEGGNIDNDSDLDMDEVVNKAIKRLEGQVLICHVLAALQHQALGNLKEALKLITEGIAGAIKTQTLAITQDAITVCGDILIELGFVISQGKSYVESDTKDLVLSLNELKVKCFPLLEVPLVVAESSIIAKNLDLGLIEQLYVTALQCYDMTLKVRVGCGNTKGLNFKLANGWNELGKFYIILTQKYCSKSNLWRIFEAARDSIIVAVDLFQKSGDICNAVACLCNLNHLYRRMGMVSTQREMEWKDSPLFLQAVSVLEEARNMLLQVKEDKSKRGEKDDRITWTRRVDMELGMTHLAYGSQLKFNCQKLLKNSKLEAAKHCHQHAVSNLHTAITLYERYMDIIPATRKQVAAVHYHLGSHYKNVSTNPTVLQSLREPSSRKVISLAERHLRLALDNFLPGSPEHEACSREYTVFVNSKR